MACGATVALSLALLPGRIACDCTPDGNATLLNARLPSAITVREVSWSRAVVPSMVDVAGRSKMCTWSRVEPQRSDGRKLHGRVANCSSTHVIECFHVLISVSLMGNRV